MHMQNQGPGQGERGWGGVKWFIYDAHKCFNVPIKEFASLKSPMDIKRYRGGEKLVLAYFGRANFDEGKIWYKILHIM